MLVYLNDLTWTRGESSGEQGSEQFAAEVHQAMDAGVHVLLTHEMIGEGQDSRFPCDFSTFFVCDRGTTPQELLQRGIYSSIAIPFKGLEWRRASTVMLLCAVEVQGDFSEAQEKDKNELLSNLLKTAVGGVKKPFKLFGGLRVGHSTRKNERRPGLAPVAVSVAEIMSASSMAEFTEEETPSQQAATAP
jgi:hypothetical protein